MRFALGVIAATVAMLSADPSTGSTRTDPRCTAAHFRAFSARVWHPRFWERGHPRAPAIRAQRRRLGCAPPAHRQAMKRTWRRDAAAYWAHRHYMRLRRIIEPFYCSGSEITFDPGWYAIPCHNVDAESGGRGGIYCNRYGLIDSTWAQYGGLAYASTACGASEWEQSLIAHRVYAIHGGSAWDPFE